jgi:site-specific DNA recombinase
MPRRKRKIKAAAYARYSSKNQVSDSTETQLKRIRTASDSGAVTSRVYPDAEILLEVDWQVTDDACSGTSIVGRDGYQRVLQGIRDHLFQVLLIDDLSRLTRDLGDMLDLYELAVFHDVEIISVSEGISSAEESAKSLFTVRGMVNDMANEAHSRRVTSRMVTHFRQGYSVGHVPYGFTTVKGKSYVVKDGERQYRKRITIDEEQATVVRRIFEMSANGIGRTKIASTLNDELIPAPKRGKTAPTLGKWTSSSIQNILQNQKCIGVWRYRTNSIVRDPETGRKTSKRNRSQIVVSMDPFIADALKIVPIELWAKVADSREKNRAAKANARTAGVAVFGDRLGKNSGDYMLSGLLSCNACGANMIRVSGKGGGRYGCADAHQGTLKCKNRSSIDSNRLEQAVLQTLDETLVQPKYLDNLAQKVNAKLEETKGIAPQHSQQLQGDISKLDKEIGNLVGFIAKGNHSDAVTSQLTNSEQRKQILQEELRKLRVVTRQRPRMTGKSIMPHARRALAMLRDKPKYARAALRGLFPTGIHVTPPQNRVRGPYKLDLTLEGANLIVADMHRADIKKPSKESPLEGSKFGQLTFCSCLRT